MDTDDEATLVDDEAQLKHYSADLLVAIEAAIPRWVERVLVERTVISGGSVSDNQQAAFLSVGEATVQLVVPELRRLLTADVDDAVGNPLAALRRGVGPMTKALDALGAPVPVRDGFKTEQFPHDRYDLVPASFGDVDPALRELGLVWGAARAHVHLRRRREEAT